MRVARIRSSVANELSITRAAGDGDTDYASRRTSSTAATMIASAV